MNQQPILTKYNAMKKLILSLTLLLIIQYSFAFSKKSKIPASINSYLVAHYPKAERVHWMIHEGNFIISLYNDETHIELCLNENGNYMNSIHEIASYDQIPDKIQSQVNIKKLAYAEKLESNEGELFYILEVNLPKGKIEEMVFDGTGVEITDHIAFNKTKEKAPDILHF
jgi:hypothetical protein